MSSPTQALVVLVLLAIGAALGWLVRGLVAGARSGRQLERLTAELERERAVAAANVQAARAEADRRAEVALSVAPVGAALRSLQEAVAAAQRASAAGHGQLAEQLQQVAMTSAQASAGLQRETRRLVGALSRSDVRGRWGEYQLGRLLESAGMIEGVHFSEQVDLPGEGGRLRPDVVVKLGGERFLVIDAKVPLTALLETEATDALEDQQAAWRAHARAVRGHVERLSAKEYWRALEGSPEFVVLFLPAESLLSEALAHDPQLLDVAFDRKVVLASPTTLLAMLRTVVLVWRRDAVTANAQQVEALGRELYDRLVTMAGHLDRLGSSINSVVGSYNRTVASLESRVLVSARRFGDLQGFDRHLGAPRQVELAARSLATSHRDQVDPDDASALHSRPEPELVITTD